MSGSESRLHSKEKEKELILKSLLKGKAHGEESLVLATLGDRTSIQREVNPNKRHSWVNEKRSTGY